MTIQTFNRIQLAEYIESAAFRSQPEIPISYHRALSHIANPLASEEDVLLLIAAHENKMLGYLGIIADRFQYPDGREEEIGVMSCLWVDSQARGQGIAGKLVVKAVELYDRKLVGTDYVPGIKKIYDRSGGFYEDPYILPGLRLYVQANLTRILPPKKPLFVTLKPALKWIDQFINLISSFHIYRRNKFSIPQNIRIEIPDEISEADFEFIKTQQQGEVFARDLKTFNWILRYPWILESPVVDALHQKYYFSSFEKKCQHRVLRLMNKDKERIAILIFLHRQDHLKLHYLYLKKDAVDEVGKLVFAKLIEWNIKTFTSFHPTLNNWMSNQRSPALCTKEIERKFVIAKSLWPWIKADPARVQSGDLDAGFT